MRKRKKYFGLLFIFVLFGAAFYVDYIAASSLFLYVVIAVISIAGILFFELSGRLVFFAGLSFFVFFPLAILYFIGFCSMGFDELSKAIARDFEWVRVGIIVFVLVVSCLSAGSLRKICNTR